MFYKELAKATFERELFLKKDTYQYQNEYRMLWFVPDKIDASIIIKCPEAIRHCERIDF